MRLCFYTSSTLLSSYDSHFFSIFPLSWDIDLRYPKLSRLLMHYYQSKTFIIKKNVGFLFFPLQWPFIMYSWFTPQGWVQRVLPWWGCTWYKKTYSVKLLIWYLKARCILFHRTKFLGADTFLMEKLRILHFLSSFFIFWDRICRTQSLHLREAASI